MMKPWKQSSTRRTYRETTYKNVECQRFNIKEAQIALNFSTMQFYTLLLSCFTHDQ